MTWLQILAQAGVMATFVGLGIALAAYFNGKHIKEGISKIADILAEMEKTANQREKTANQRHEEAMESLRNMEKTANQRHEEAMESLRKGFGTR